MKQSDVAGHKIQRSSHSSFPPTRNVVRNYSQDKASSSSHTAAADAIDGWSDDEDDDEGMIDPDSLDRDDDLSRPSSRSPSRPSSSSSPSSSSPPSGSSSYAINDAKYYSYLLTLLSARQHRAAVLAEAAQKLELTRNLMATRGATARNVSSGKKQANMAELVAQGKMTSNGLALPGNEEEDDDEGGEDDGEGKRRKLPKVFKWSKERKR